MRNGRRHGKLYKAPSCRRHVTAAGFTGTGIETAEKRGLEIGERIRDALDPTKAPSKVRTLADMTPEERASLVAQLRPPKSRQ